MEARTKVAAAAASVIPFSCVICFDEFDTTERPPMVLPCGHTYVCLPCTKRLKRCMECREPLFLPAHNKPPAGAATTSASSRASGRFSPNLQAAHHHHPSTPTKSTNKAEPIPLPIPKNVVLLAMMEAAERQAKEMSEQRKTPEKADKEDAENDSHSDDSDTDNDDDDDDEEEETFNLDHIITGMATLSGPCGTYAVKESDGLALYPHDPRLETPEDDDCPPESVLLPQIPSEPTNSLLDEEKKQDEYVLEVNSADEEDNVVSFVLQKSSPKRMESIEILARGQKLQIVSFEGGVAKLARGRGYVRATSRQLVKGTHGSINKIHILT